MRPYLGQVEWIIGNLFGLLFRHDLHAHAPLREFAPLDGVEKIFLRGFTRTSDYFSCLSVCPVTVTLHRFEMELYPIALVFSVNDAKGMRSIAIHESSTL